MSPPRPALSALVLAGGAARRMGGEKALAVLQGRTLLECSLLLAADVADETLLLPGARALPLAGWERVRRIPDEPGEGPLAALEAGLAAASHEWCLLLACDMPFVRAALVRRLARETLTTPAEAVLLSTPDGLQPFPGCFHRRALGPLREHVRAGGGSLRGLLERLHVHALSAEDVADVDPVLHSLRNLNTPDELRAAREAVGQGVM